MKFKVTTTITTLVDVETLETEHAVQINAEEWVPQKIATAVATGACKSVLLQLDTEERDQ